MTMAMDPAARKAMFANIASNKLPGTGPALPRPPRAPRLSGMSKGTGPIPASYAAGGPVIQESRSRFMKTADQFRENVERQSYAKSGKTGELSNTTKDKSLPAIKPRA
jgi:hypothetical protein